MRQLPPESNLINEHLYLYHTSTLPMGFLPDSQLHQLRKMKHFQRSSRVHMYLGVYTPWLAMVFAWRRCQGDVIHDVLCNMTSCDMMSSMKPKTMYYADLAIKIALFWLPQHQKVCHGNQCPRPDSVLSKFQNYELILEFGKQTFLGPITDP